MFELFLACSSVAIGIIFILDRKRNVASQNRGGPYLLDKPGWRPLPLAAQERIFLVVGIAFVAMSIAWVVTAICRLV
jgi:hypothetical protein